MILRFDYLGIILESNGMRSISQKKGKRFENLGNYVQNLKIFWKTAIVRKKLLEKALLLMKKISLSINKNKFLPWVLQEGGVNLQNWPMITIIAKNPQKLPESRGF